MNFRAGISGYGPVEFASFIPEDLVAYHLPGSQVFSATGACGKLMLQEIPTSIHTVLLALFKCHENTTINLTLDEPGLRVQIALEGNFDLRFEEFERFVLKEGEANMYYSPFLNGVGIFKRGHTYLLLDVTYNIEKLKELRNYFSVLISFLQMIEKNEPAMLTARITITKEMWQIINHIIHYTYEDELLPLYANHYLHNFLLLLLRQIGKPESVGTHHAETDKFYLAEEIIGCDLLHHPNTFLIAKKIGISESAFVKGFKQLFGDAPGTYWRKLGLRKAAELLRNTDLPINEIGALVGYVEASSFSKSFKKEFKMRPGEWRKKIE